MKNYLSLLLLIPFLSVLSCESAEEVPDDDEELITTIRLTFQETGGAPSYFSWKDIDGPTGSAPTIDTIKISKGKTYTMKVSFLNESNPASPEDITPEIQTEGANHQLFFTITTTPSGIVTHAYADTDSNGLPIGLTNTITTAATATTGSGSTFRLFLKHQPGQKTTTSGVTTGGTDADVTFPIRIN
jgi:hypothetical protein